jgi:hypothetical protein
MMTAFTDKNRNIARIFALGFTDLEKALGISLSGSKMALSFRMAATRLERTKNGGHCHCYKTLKAMCLPLK